MRDHVKAYACDQPIYKANKNIGMTASDHNLLIGVLSKGPNTNNESDDGSQSAVDFPPSKGCA